MKRIYISDIVHEHLKKEARREGRTLQWVVENRLAGTPVETTPPQKIISAQTPQVDDLFQKNSVASNIPAELHQVVHVPDVTALEKPCCLNENQPCKHWVWDITTGEGYKNTLSGRYREAE